MIWDRRIFISKCGMRNEFALSAVAMRTGETVCPYNVLIWGKEFALLRICNANGVI